MSSTIASFVQDYLPESLSTMRPIVTADDLPGPTVAISIAVATTVFIALWKRFRKSGQYSFLPGPENKTNFGYLPDMHEETSLNDYHYTMTEKYGHVTRLKGGMFGLQEDGLYITDPLALQSILVRNQKNFRESIEFSGLFGIIHHGDGLASVHDTEHKKQRKLMNPIFTASFVSKLVPVFYNIANQLRDKLKVELGDTKQGKEIDVLDNLTRTALELISQGGLGHTFNSFDHDSKDFTEFHEALKTVLPMAGRIFFALPYLETWRKIEPVWLRRGLASIVDWVPYAAARKFKWGVDTMHPVCKDLFWKKRAILAEGGISELEKMTAGGQDLATLLISANQVADEEERMPDDVVIANMSSIVLGGQETTSGALTRLLCLMATNTDLQERLRQEINNAKVLKGEDEFNYNELNDLPLLDAVCRETLRLFAPVTFVWRQTIDDCIVPLQFPVKDVRTGAEVKELLIKQGTPVYLGLAAANRSKAIWGDDADELKPERWLGKIFLESTQNGIKMPGIFSNIMTFLGGGRACPGMKFALLEIKLVLSVLITNFAFEKVTKEIDWRMGITVVPHIKDEVHKGPSVPMVVRRLV